MKPSENLSRKASNNNNLLTRRRNAWMLHTACSSTASGSMSIDFCTAKLTHSKGRQKKCKPNLGEVSWRKLDSHFLATLNVASPRRLSLSVGFARLRTGGLAQERFRIRKLGPDVAQTSCSPPAGQLLVNFLLHILGPDVPRKCWLNLCGRLPISCH